VENKKGFYGANIPRAHTHERRKSSFLQHDKPQDNY